MSKSKTAFKILFGLIGAAGAVAIACSACCLPIVGVIAAVSSLGAAISGWYTTAAGLFIIALAVIMFRRKKTCKSQSSNPCTKACPPSTTEG